MTNANKNEVELPRHWFQGARATDGGPELSEATLEEACEWIARANIGYGLAFRWWLQYGVEDWFLRSLVGTPGETRQMVLQREFRKLQERQRKEIVPLWDGDKLVGQIAIMRPFDARDYLPFVERIHPDDAKLGDAPVPGRQVTPKDVRIQRFYLHKGRYRLEGSF